MQQMRSASLLRLSGHLTKQTNLAFDGLGEFTVGASEPVLWVYFVALRMNWMSPTASKGHYTVLLHFTSSIAIAFGYMNRQTRAVLAGRLQPEKNLIASPTISDRRPHSAAPCSRCRNLPVITGPDQQ
ncbi:hypothetical protein QR685DRAFT_574596 [Neurospora intermedia]|uniref:Uncharacterized protein n=1 Tax=Neurospora intermedia TaxID=5142 RepID=A0ABR3D382_NEUIN